MTAADLTGSAAILAAAFGILPNAWMESTWRELAPRHEMSIAGANGFRWNARLPLERHLRFGLRQDVATSRQDAGAPRRMTGAHLSGSAAILAAAFGILPNAWMESTWRELVPRHEMSIAGVHGFRWNGTCALDCYRSRVVFLYG